MRRRILLAGVLSALPTAAFAQDKKKEKTLRERLQGRWVRLGHPYSFEVKGNQWAHFDEKQPFKPTGTGEIQYPQGKDYAIVKATGGYVWWLFSAGENVVAAEHFREDGSLEPGCDGRIFYRQGTKSP